MTRQEIIDLLNVSGKSGLDDLFRRASEVRKQYVGDKVYFRGLIELSNICAKNCFYCGIRKDNAKSKRYLMTEAETVSAAKWAYDAGYGSVVIQAGEREDEAFVTFIEKIILAIMEATGGKIGITLSLGEQKAEVYRRWLAAGAKRYLLRIETSSPELYSCLHPVDHSFTRRLECLGILKKEGYQLGTGVMIGLPGQTVENLAEDILFFEKMDVDMIGMGPYIPHEDTPLYSRAPEVDRDRNFSLGLKMIAAARIHLKDINIASTTALQALNPLGRELGLEAGANVIMPNITDTKYRASYQLYDGKPCLDENASLCKTCLEARIKSVGREIGYFEEGVPEHFLRRTRGNTAG